MGYEPRRQMSTVTCSDCGKETTVPFKPTAGRPVYCRECYQKHRRF
ncbi:MAG: CxxC-x17-CxxC domain-containing protein [Candidatus Bathyarchaeia archaeon]